MKLFDVYPLYDIALERGEGCYVYDDRGTRYLDLYGGHAVISIGHSHPHFVGKLSHQLQKLSFYSNSVRNPLQEEVAAKLGNLSGMEKFSLFFCNSGAEANENALKLASFHTGRKKVISFKKAFHGRTSAAVGATDDPSIRAPINESDDFIFLQLNHIAPVEVELRRGNISAVILEGIQGIGGIHLPDWDFLRGVAKICRETGTVLILDEIQSGFGRSGNFFAFQNADIEPDIVTVAKGMGNGFPVGGVLVHPKIQPRHGMLGTTFGGNQLACTAVLATLEIIEEEDLITNARLMEDCFRQNLQGIPGLKEIRGRGLMLGLDFDFEIASLRKKLLFGHNIFTGSSSDQHVLRILPPLCLKENDANYFFEAIGKILKK